MPPEDTTTPAGGPPEARDLIGYGGEPPEARWPGGARLAVNLVLNYEEGAELSPVDGDERREPRSEFAYDIAPGDRDLLQETVYEYGSRAGVWRVLRILDHHEVPATVFASARALERNRAVARAFLARGYDIVGHGYRWVGHHGMGEVEERQAIEQAVDSLRRITGGPIEGWFTRPLPSPRTRRLLVEAGIRWDSDSYGDDLPYYVRVGTRDHLVIPYTIDVNDIRYWNGSANTADDWFAYARDAFDALYEEGRERPKMMSVGLHARISGRPGRSRGLSKFLAYLRTFPDVWVCRRTEIAEHWSAQHPPHRARR